MSGISSGQRQICFYLLCILTVSGFRFRVGLAHQCSHGHGHHHDHVHHAHDHVSPMMNEKIQREPLLPEEIAEEEDLEMMWADNHDHDHGIHDHMHHGYAELSGLNLWIYALACSLLVSLASLVCLIFLPIFTKGKPSKTVVDALALFGAGAMLGDAFLHQLPHAFGGGNSHSHDHHGEHDHNHLHSGQSHSHSIKELSVGLSILAGIVLFLIVEKLVRFIENSTGGNALGHGHHNHKHIKNLKDGDSRENNEAPSHGEEEEKNQISSSEDTSKGKICNDLTDTVMGDLVNENGGLRKRSTQSAPSEGIDSLGDANNSTHVQSPEPVKPQSNLVFGYLNLFSDGVHNFTDGMALGSAFLLYGSIGGWSRTLFLLAHELPQEIGDFGILVRSGFSTSKALFFNFLSALVALAGTALALTWGKDPGQSSIIEGLTAGGFIYISLGVLSEMNATFSSLRNAAIELMSFVLGMAVALCISLAE